jgi:fumarate hydratase class II
MSRKKPSSKLYGKQTELAVKNFKISGWTIPSELIQALAFVKKHAAKTNGLLKKIPSTHSKAIFKAAKKIQEGEYLDQFPVDVFQTGSGTSTNMNMNEVLATLASTKTRTVHPNDHVNCCQSSNDVIPTAIQVACALKATYGLMPVLKEMQEALLHKASEFHHIVKTGRTHLMDAVPISLGDEFRAFAALIEKTIWKIQQSTDGLCILPLGGTAVGTGINAHPSFAKKTIEAMSKEVGLPFSEAENHMAAQSCPTALLSHIGALREAAIVLEKIANDIRHMNSGPIAGLGELKLPALQAGSSIMPGKVNPVMCESMMQVSMYIKGADATVQAGMSGASNFQLNTAYPIMAQSLIMSLRLLSNSAFGFTRYCILGIEANAKNIEESTAKNPMLATALIPFIGYDKAAEIANEAMAKKQIILEVAIRRTDLPETKLQKILDPEKLCTYH